MQMSDILVTLLVFGNPFSTRCRALVDTHRVCERAREEVVVTFGDDGHDLSERVLLFVC